MMMCRLFASGRMWRSLREAGWLADWLTGNDRREGNRGSHRKKRIDETAADVAAGSHIRLLWTSFDTNSRLLLHLEG